MDLFHHFAFFFGRCFAFFNFSFYFFSFPFWLAFWFFFCK